LMDIYTQESAVWNVPVETQLELPRLLQKTGW
jgi:hypothetical protein